MGIARRKAGTVVRCPACASQVTVPHPPGEGSAHAKVEERYQATAAEAPPPLFERSDFDDLFNMGAQKPRPAPEPFVYESFVPPSPAEHFDKVQQQRAAAPQPQVAAADRPAAASAAPGPPSGRPGIWLTPGLATLLSVAAVVALALAFAAGLLVGIFLQPGPKDEQTQRHVKPTVISQLVEVVK
jgi:hypothetical protein